LSEEASKSLSQWLKETLGDKVNEVRASQRLVESPAVVVDADKFMTANMRRMMKAMKQDGPELPAAKHDLEINPAHPIHGAPRRHAAEGCRARRQRRRTNPRQRPRGRQLLEDPRAMLTRLNSLLEKSADERLIRSPVGMPCPLMHRPSVCNSRVFFISCNFVRDNGLGKLSV